MIGNTAGGCQKRMIRASSGPAARGEPGPGREKVTPLMAEHRTRHSAARPPVRTPPGASTRRQHTVRIIGGQWKRTPLPVTDAPGLRPTPDRVRETLFNWLTHHCGGDLAGRRVLDLFAGTGALGFEAASRGARPVLLVEQNAVLVRQLRAIRDKLGADPIDIRQADALATLAGCAARGERFDIILLDPPFGAGWLPRLLPLLPGLLTPDGYVYAEAESALGALCATDEALLAPFEVLKADKAGQVFYHLLRCKI